MRVSSLFVALGLVSLGLSPGLAADEAFDLGFTTDTQVNDQGSDQDICPDTELLQNDDGAFENGYAWGFAGVQPPDYGAFAECYSAAYVCGIQFAFTQTGYAPGHTMDVYVYEDDGVPPPDNNPGNVICVVTGIDPNPIDFWPSVSLHDVRVCCLTGGDLFAAFWGAWPDGNPGWFIAGDEEGSGAGCPRTKFAPGIGYPTGWGDINLIPIFGADALGIRVFSGEGDCPGTPTEDTTWGKIKSLY